MSIAIESTMPGVTVLVNQGQVSRPLERQPTSTLFAIGFAPWGEIGVPRTITSWAEFVRLYGGFHPGGYLAEAAYIFFNHFGGKQMVVCRAGATTAPTSHTFVSANSKEPALEMRAKHPSLQADVKATVNGGNLVLESVFLGVREVYSDFIISNEAVARLNQRSRLVKATLVGEIGQGLNNAEHTFVTGSDGSDTFNVAQFADFVAAFADEGFGSGQICVPGVSDVGVQAALVAHATQFKRLALLDTQLGDPLGSAETLSAEPALRSPYAALYTPWVEMLAVEGGGLRKFYPPSIFAAGACAQVDRTVGTHKAPANLAIPTALDVERHSDGKPTMTDATRAYLNSKQVNAIVPIPSEGVKIYGARVLYPVSDTRVRFVHEQRVLNLIYYTAKIGLGWAVFQPVDGTGRLFRDLRAAGRNFLRSLWRAGALYGANEDAAFSVVCDGSNNPPEELEQGRVHLQLGVKLSPTAEQIVVNIDNVGLSQDLSVLQG